MPPKIGKKNLCYKNNQVSNEKIYHLLQKGVNELKIFLNDDDYLRFIYGLFVFNSRQKLANTGYYFIKNPNKISLFENNLFEKKLKNPLVEILAFVLMPTHFHLILKTKTEKNISLFMQKICAGYALYFNKKYHRDGVLFNGRYKSIVLKNKIQLLSLLHYIHANPLKLNHPQDLSAVEPFEFLKNYRWSSYIDYCGWNNFPQVVKKEFLFNFLNGPENYKKKFHFWFSNQRLNLNQIAHLTLEENQNESSKLIGVLIFVSFYFSLVSNFFVE